jgi:hypothetical protein
LGHFAVTEDRTRTLKAALAGGLRRYGKG